MTKSLLYDKTASTDRLSSEGNLPLLRSAIRREPLTTTSTPSPSSNLPAGSSTPNPNQSHLHSTTSAALLKRFFRPHFYAFFRHTHKAQVTGHSASQTKRLSSQPNVQAPVENLHLDRQVTWLVWHCCLQVSRQLVAEPGTALDDCAAA